jgi:hypothetical protein
MSPFGTSTTASPSGTRIWDRASRVSVYPNLLAGGHEEDPHGRHRS